MNLLRAAATLLFLIALPEYRAQAPAENYHSAVLQDFQNRLSQYLKLRKKVEGELPKLKRGASAAAITQHERDLASGLREARAGSRQGELFTPEIAAEFRGLIRMTMQGREAARIEHSLRSAEPVRLTPGVNAPYPDGIPLQSTPPTLLLNLPKLPPEVEYRVVGNALLLRDTGANLIVDFILSAVPAEPSRTTR